MGLFTKYKPALLPYFEYDNTLYPMTCGTIASRQENIDHVTRLFDTYLTEELTLTANLKQSIELSFAHQVTIINLRYLNTAAVYQDFCTIFRRDNVSRAAERFYDVVQYIDMTVDQDWRIYNKGQFIRSMLALTTDEPGKKAWMIPLRATPWVHYLVYCQQAAATNVIYQAQCRRNQVNQAIPVGTVPFMATR